MISNKELLDLLDGVELCDINSGHRYWTVGVYSENHETAVSIEEVERGAN